MELFLVLFVCVVCLFLFDVFGLYVVFDVVVVFFGLDGGVCGVWFDLVGEVYVYFF